MYALYGHHRYFKFKRKYQQYGSCFETIFPCLMTMALPLYNYNCTNITNTNKTFLEKTMSLELKAREWWECSGDELWAVNLRRPNFVAQDDECPHRGGSQALKNMSCDHSTEDEFVSLTKPIVLWTTGKKILCWSIFEIEPVAYFWPFLGYWRSQNLSRDNDVKGNLCFMQNV